MSIFPGGSSQQCSRHLSAEVPLPPVAQETGVLSKRKRPTATCRKPGNYFSMLPYELIENIARFSSNVDALHLLDAWYEIRQDKKPRKLAEKADYWLQVMGKRIKTLSQKERENKRWNPAKEAFNLSNLYFGEYSPFTSNNRQLNFLLMRERKERFRVRMVKLRLIWLQSLTMM